MPRSPGRTGHRYRLAVKRLRQPGAVCVLCGREIDVALKFPHPWSWTLQHLNGDHWDNRPDNHGSAHLRCNSREGGQKGRAIQVRAAQAQRRVSRRW